MQSNFAGNLEGTTELTIRPCRCVYEYVPEGVCSTWQHRRLRLSPSTKHTKRQRG